VKGVKQRALNKEALDRLYDKYNRREFVHPDPLEFLYRYDNVRDREVAGLIASSLAYGRVKQILRSVSFVLDRMGPSPLAFLVGSSQRAILALFEDFVHRFTTGQHIAAMLTGARRVIRQYGSLHACFVAGMRDSDETVIPALSDFVKELLCADYSCGKYLVPTPDRGSACKRLHLFLRWMVRRDAVDPGGWDDVSPSKLVIPLDTHMHKIGLALGMTNRKQGDIRTALGMTAAFREIAPDDPVRYDFALTRLGIRDDTDMDAFLKEYASSENKSHESGLYKMQRGARVRSGGRPARAGTRR
jgi:uncharacterized protein (TIGR02757 family)